jgi:hypothetical protein
MYRIVQVFLHYVRSGIFFLQEKLDTAGLVYIASVIAAVIASLITDLDKPGTAFFSLSSAQRIFGLAAFLTCSYLLYMLLHKKERLQKALVTAVMVEGMVLRLCYTLFTGPGTRTYDVYRDEWGHIDYIRYIAEHIKLPPVNTCQAYHPPVHHIIAAFAMNTGKAFTFNEFLQLKLIQLVMTLFSCLSLILVFKLLRQLNIDGHAVAAGTAVFAFHPSNIYFASRLNNDNTMLFFYIAGLYYLFKWSKDKKLKNILLLSAFISIAVLTKKNALMLLLPVAAVFAAALTADRKQRRSYFRQFTVFAAMTVPLALSHQLRNYILFGQDFGYVPSLGKGFTPTTFNLLYLPVGNMLKSPFNDGKA